MDKNLIKSNIRILLLFTYGVSLSIWNKMGIISREISLYKALCEKNVEYSFLTYGSDDDKKYLNILNGIEIIPIKKHLKSKIPKFHYVKSIYLPLKLRNIFKKIDIIKTNQIIGSWFALTIKILFRKKLIIRGGYEKLIRHKHIGKKKGIKNQIKYYIDYSWIFLLELIFLNLQIFLIQ